MAASYTILEVVVTGGCSSATSWDRVSMRVPPSSTMACGRRAANPERVARH
jgi:hypothetical protein